MILLLPAVALPLAYRLHSSSGVIYMAKKAVSEDTLTSLAIDLGAEDIKTGDDEVFEVITAPADFETIKAKLAEAKIPFESASVSFVPKNTIKLEGDEARKCLEFIDALDEHEDVKSVNANFDISKEVLEKVMGSA